MKILGRYILREYLIPLGYCLGGFVAIYVLFELFGSLSRILDAKLPFAIAVGYFGSYIAPFFQYLAPAALMLAALYTMWNFCRHSELVAMRASGVSFSAIVRPILLVAILMACAVACVNEFAVPRYAQWAKRLRNERFELAKLERISGIVYRNAKSDRTWTVGSLEKGNARHLLGVKVVQDYPNGGGPMTSVMAERADYLDGEWWFTNPSVHHFDLTGTEVATPTPELDELKTRVFPSFSERPSDLLMQDREPRYNSVRGKLRYMRTNGDLSERARREWTYDAWAQAASPFACIVITLFALPAGVFSGRQSVFRGILGALGLFFAYYGFVVLCWVCAYRGLLPPIPAALLPAVVFLALGFVALRKVR